MYIASNGFMEYLNAILHYFELESYFVDVYGADKFATSSKEELVERWFQITK
jgi:FMN phosphatase YigB (HAD superfamily)